MSATLLFKTFSFKNLSIILYKIHRPIDSHPMPHILAKNMLFIRLTRWRGVNIDTLTQCCQIHRYALIGCVFWADK